MGRSATAALSLPGLNPGFPAQLDELAENIQAVGLVRAITIKPDGTIKDGERRWMAFRDVLFRADKTKFGQIPVIVCADMISGAGGGE